MPLHPYISNLTPCNFPNGRVCKDGIHKYIRNCPIESTRNYGLWGKKGGHGGRLKDKKTSGSGADSGSGSGSQACTKVTLLMSISIGYTLNCFLPRKQDVVSTNSMCFQQGSLILSHCCSCNQHAHHQGFAHQE